MPLHNTASTLSISIQEFSDFDLDLYGWYALGHHDPTAFFNAVAALDSRVSFLQQEVRLGWAEFCTGGFDFVARSLPGLQPITVIAWSGNRLIDH